MKTNYLIAAALCTLFFSAKTQAQSTLEVRCYSNSSIFTSIYLDENLIEYACIGDPAFYVAVFDSTCTAWKTNYDGNGYDFGNVIVRNRVESYFIFRHDNLDELNGMNGMLDAIPPDHSFVVYTPSFDYNSVNTLCPTLVQTLSDHWSNNVLQSNIMVLYGIKDQPGTFVSEIATDETDQNGDYILFNTELSCPGALGVTENAFEAPTVLYNGNGTFTVETEGTLNGIMLIDLSGRELAYAENGNQLTVRGELPTGTYIVRGMLDGRPWSRKVVVQ